MGSSIPSIFLCQNFRQNETTVDNLQNVIFSNIMKKIGKIKSTLETIKFFIFSMKPNQSNHFEIQNLHFSRRSFPMLGFIAYFLVQGGESKKIKNLLYLFQGLLVVFYRFLANIFR